MSREEEENETSTPPDICDICPECAEQMSWSPDGCYCGNEGCPRFCAPSGS